MLDSLFAGVFDTALTNVIAPADFLLCVLVSLGIGVMLCAMTLWRARSSGSFAVALALLPAVVCVVIMLVNGNLGTAVAVAGAFSLVRFRSAPGSAREICALFIAMGAGLVAGMGYLGYAVLFALVMGVACMALTAAGWGEDRRGRTLRITTLLDTVLGLSAGLIGAAVCAALLLWDAAQTATPLHLVSFQLLWAVVNDFTALVMLRL